MSYIQNDFLLTNRRAQDLYNNYAKNMPIFDYHCHLKEREILEDKPFENLWEVWLKGDHYKWRLMRNYGIDEEWITGSKSPKEKYLAYVKTLERAYGNPLYHWSAMELKYYLGCELEINEKNAETIWKNANDFIRKNQLSPLKLISQSKVEFIFTTNEVFDDLSVFDEIKKKMPDSQHPIPENLPELHVKIIPEIDTFPPQHLSHQCSPSDSFCFQVQSLPRAPAHGPHCGIPSVLSEKLCHPGRHTPDPHRPGPELPDRKTPGCPCHAYPVPPDYRHSRSPRTDDS